MRWDDRVLPLAFYGGLTALLVLVVTGSLAGVLPRELVKDLAEDSEALLLALGLCGWIEFARPRLLGTRHGWLGTALAAAGCLLLGSCLFIRAAFPESVATLSEPMLALAVLLPYLQLRRPAPALLVAGLPGAVLLLILLAFHSAIVTRGSEMLAMLVLVPLGLDVIDRRILQPSADTSAALLWSWCLLLIGAPVLLSVVLRGAFPGVLGRAVGYAVGLQEAWLGLLLVHLYLALRRARGLVQHVDYRCAGADRFLVAVDDRDLVRGRRGR